MNRTRGFTLIEILIALMVFAVLATITSMAMLHAFNTRDRLQAASDQMNQMVMALTHIQRATEQMVNRAIRGDQGHTFAAFIGKPQYMELTQGGFINPLGEAQRSTLKRQAFLCQNKQLILRSWPVLDPIKRSNYQDKILLTELADCHFEYLNHANSVLNEWRANAVNERQQSETLPKAIKITLNSPHLGKAQLLYPVNGGLNVSE